jgi:hypothetical protein
MNEEEDAILLDKLNFVRSEVPGANNNLSETQIEYTLILVLENNNNTNNNEEEKTTTVDYQQDKNEAMKTINDVNLEAQVQLLYEEIINYVEEVAADYIWNNERFYLDKPARSTGDKSDLSPRPIYTSSGCLDYGDNVEDEWFIVYLLFKLTKKFPGRLAAKCGDSDGEFLLIHAANYLPDWASQATNMTNRVFIYSNYQNSLSKKV